MTDATAGVHHGIGGLGGLAGGRAGAAGPTPDPQQPAYTPGELVNAGHRFFGGIASGLAGLIEKAVGQWACPMDMCWASLGVHALQSG
jgi:hypothetical protein